MHLSKPWIKAKLIGDWAGAEFVGPNIKWKHEAPVEKKVGGGEDFYLPFVVFSTTYQGGFVFVFFF